MGHARKEASTVSPARTVAAVVAAAVMATLGGFTSSASGHSSGCSFAANKTAPVGHPYRVYSIPHGCASLELPAKVGLPTVVVRQHTSRGRVITRRFRAPNTNLDIEGGSVGIAGRSHVARPSARWTPQGEMTFVVKWPFVTVTGFEVYAPSGRREFTDIPLAWTLWVSPTLNATWLAMRGSQGG